MVHPKNLNYVIIYSPSWQFSNYCVIFRRGNSHTGLEQHEGE